MIIVFFLWQQTWFEYEIKTKQTKKEKIYIYEVSIWRKYKTFLDATVQHWNKQTKNKKTTRYSFDFFCQTLEQCILGRARVFGMFIFRVKSCNIMKLSCNAVCSKITEQHPNDAYWYAIVCVCSFFFFFFTMHAWVTVSVCRVCLKKLKIKDSSSWVWVQLISLFFLSSVQVLLLKSSFKRERHVNVNVHVCVSECKYMCVCVWMQVHVCMCLNANTCVRMCVCPQCYFPHLQTKVWQCTLLWPVF